MILDPTRAGPTGPAGRRTGIFLLEFLRHPAAAMVMVVAGSLGRCGGHDAGGHGHGGKESKHGSFHIWLEGRGLEAPGRECKGLATHPEFDHPGPNLIDKHSQSIDNGCQTRANAGLVRDGRVRLPTASDISTTFATLATSDRGRGRHT